MTFKHIPISGSVPLSVQSNNWLANHVSATVEPQPGMNDDIPDKGPIRADSHYRGNREGTEREEKREEGRECEISGRWTAILSCLSLGTTDMFALVSWSVVLLTVEADEVESKNCLSFVFFILSNQR